MRRVSYPWIPRTGRQLVMSCVDMTCLFGIAGYALKLPTFFNHLVYYPLIPNLGDSVFLLVCAGWFALRLRSLYARN